MMIQLLTVDATFCAAIVVHHLILPWLVHDSKTSLGQVTTDRATVTAPCSFVAVPF